MKALLVSCLLVGCVGTATSSVPGPSEGDGGSSDSTGPVPALEPPTYSAARCEGAPPARTFHGFNGEVLEAGRIDEAQGLDTRRTQLFERSDSVTNAFNAMLGYWLAADGIVTAANTNAWNLRQHWWFSEPSGGALLFFSQYRLSFLTCERNFRQKQGLGAAADFEALPTFDSATTQCTRLMTELWSTVPTQEALDTCVDWALNGTASEQVPSRRWAYVCATVASTTYLTTD